MLHYQRKRLVCFQAGKKIAAYANFGISVTAKLYTKICAWKHLRKVVGNAATESWLISIALFFDSFIQVDVWANPLSIQERQRGSALSLALTFILVSVEADIQNNAKVICGFNNNLRDLSSDRLLPAIEQGALSASWKEVWHCSFAYTVVPTL